MRGMGDTTAYLRRGIREIICLALFFFTFLACEYLFDVRMAEFVSSNEVVIYESLVLGASVIGFFVRPILYYHRPHAIDATSDVTGVLLVAALLLLIMAVRVEVVIAGGLMACCALGYCGSTAHANFARRFARTPCLARAAALSYAIGVLVQVLNHMVMPAGIPQQAVLVVCAIVQVALLHGARRAKLRDESDPNFEPSAAGLSVDALEYGAKWHDDPEAKAAFRRTVARLTVATAELTSDERLDAFVATFELTERERDILEALVVSDQSVQDIATTLFLSRSTLYRHISSINKKTGTASRVALINFFWSWTPND